MAQALHSTRTRLQREMLMPIGLPHTAYTGASSRAFQSLPHTSAVGGGAAVSSRRAAPRAGCRS